MLTKSMMLATCLIFSSNCFSGDKKAVEVKDEHGNEVVGNIYVNLLDTEHFVGKTDDKGALTLETGCNIHDIVIAVPDNPFYHGGKKRCGEGSSKVVVKVIEKSFYTALKQNAEKLVNDDEFAKAALVYSEIASREIDSEKAIKARELSITNYAKSVGLDPSSRTVVYFDPDQEMKVVGPALKLQIKEFQESRNLKGPTALNYDVLSEKAGTDIGQFMYLN